MYFSAAFSLACQPANTQRAQVHDRGELRAAVRPAGEHGAAHSAGVHVARLPAVQCRLADHSAGHRLLAALTNHERTNSLHVQVIMIIDYSVFE
jgi:hypothetical protein